MPRRTKTKAAPPKRETVWKVYGSGKPKPEAIALLARMAWDAAGKELAKKAEAKGGVDEKHCRLGDATSNVREMYARIDVRKARGEFAYNAVLDDETVRFILAAHEFNGSGARKLCDVLGIGERTIRKVIERKSWAHIAVPTGDVAELIVAGFIEKHAAKNNIVK